jgi:hypothetical protein
MTHDLCPKCGKGFSTHCNQGYGYFVISPVGSGFFDVLDILNLAKEKLHREVITHWEFAKIRNIYCTHAQMCTECGYVWGQRANFQGERDYDPSILERNLPAILFDKDAEIRARIIGEEKARLAKEKWNHVFEEIAKAPGPVFAVRVLGEGKPQEEKPLRHEVFWEIYQATGKYEDMMTWLKHRAWERQENL